jgi:hypothetical protein
MSVLIVRRKVTPPLHNNYVICVPLFSRMQCCKVVQSLVNKYEVEKMHKINTTKLLKNYVPWHEQSEFLYYHLHVEGIVLYF